MDHHDGDTAGRIGVRSLDVLAQTYGAGIASARIYQLYIFWIFIETLWIPLNVVFAVLIHYLVLLLAAWQQSGQAGDLDLSSHWQYFRLHAELPWFVLAWVCFHVYTAFRPLYPVLACVALGLAHNQWQAFTLYDKRPAAEKYPGAAFDLTLADQTAMGLFLGGLALTHLYFFWLSVDAQRRMHARSDGERALLSEYDGGGSLAKSAARVLNLPPALRMARRKVAAGILLFVSGISNYSNYIACAIVFMSLAGFIPMAVWYVHDMRIFAGVARGGQLAYGYAFGVGILVLVLLLGAGAVWYIRLLGRLATRAARYLLRRSLEEVQAIDPRPPVLFLRSFADDQVALTPRRFDFRQWLLDETSRSVNLDYLILQEGTDVGPTVALGKPGDPVPPYGVARGYFAHDDWQRAVRDLCAQASGIILVLDTTEGVAWEIELLLAQNHLNKTLVLLKQEDCGTAQGRRLMRLVTDRMAPDAPLPEELGEGFAGKSGEAFGLWVDGESRPHLLTTTRASAYAYQMALRLFLRNLPVAAISS